MQTLFFSCSSPQRVLFCLCRRACVCVCVCFSFTEEQVVFVFSCANDGRALALDHFSSFFFFFFFSLSRCVSARICRFQRGQLFSFRAQLSRTWIEWCYFLFSSFRSENVPIERFLRGIEKINVEMCWFHGCFICFDKGERSLPLEWIPVRTLERRRSALFALIETLPTVKATEKLVDAIRFDLHFTALDHLLKHVSDFSRITTSQWMLIVIFHRREIGLIHALTSLEIPRGISCRSRSWGVRLPEWQTGWCTRQRDRWIDDKKSFCFGLIDDVRL